MPPCPSITIRFSDCWSSVEGSRSGTENVTGEQAGPGVPGTLGQLDHQSVHRALAAWRTLDHQVQLQWAEYARGGGHRPPSHENTSADTTARVGVYGFATLGTSTFQLRHGSRRFLRFMWHSFPHRLPGMPTWYCGFRFSWVAPKIR